MEKIHQQEHKLREQHHRTCISQPRYPINQAFCQVGPIHDYQTLRHSEPSGTESSASVDVLLGNLSFRASLRSDLLAAENAIYDSECPINEIIRPVMSGAMEDPVENLKREDEPRGLVGYVGNTLPRVPNATGDDYGKVIATMENVAAQKVATNGYEQAIGHAANENLGKERSGLEDWDPSLVERHIENEEWVAFLQRSMEEVMDGEIDSLLQKNCVSVFVSPLRNPAADCRVVEYVACLLSLPFVTRLCHENIDKIERVYLDVRVVPNLVYAMKLIMSERTEKNETVTLAQSPETRLAALLSADELQSLEASMLILCRLVYARQQFLTQFCDAVYIVNGIPFLQQLLTLEKRKARIIGDLVAVLNNILRLQPENADLVEQVIVRAKSPGQVIELFEKLFTHRQSIIRSRMCTLVRLLGRFCCRALQRIWCKQLRLLLESLAQSDDDEFVRNVRIIFFFHLFYFLYLPY